MCALPPVALRVKCRNSVKTPVQVLVFWVDYTFPHFILRLHNVSTTRSHSVNPGCPGCFWFNTLSSGFSFILAWSFFFYICKTLQKSCFFECKSFWSHASFLWFIWFYLTLSLKSKPYYTLIAKKNPLLYLLWEVSWVIHSCIIFRLNQLLTSSLCRVLFFAYLYLFFCLSCVNQKKWSWFIEGTLKL